MDWKSTLASLTHNAEAHFDQLKFRFKQRFNLVDPIQILPYRGYGTPRRLYLKGRVLEDKGITPLDSVQDNERVWHNLLNMYRRLESDEIPNAKLVARFQNSVVDLVADDEGYFEFQLEPEHPIETTTQVWHEVAFELVAPRIDEQRDVKALGYILIPPEESEFGVISDIDDTVVQTSATHLLKMARITFLGNARTRLPFKGVAAFYQALQQGQKPKTYNPIFYVSSSPWNLYDLLVDFFELQDIPLGPLFLRDYGFSSSELLPLGHKQYKLAHIQAILETYPQLRFILIGDSGQEDPEIYRQVVHDYPDRILAIYIRDVFLEGRADQIKVIIEDLRTKNVEMLLVPDTFVAAQHAAERGLIAKTALSRILQEKTEAEGEPGAIEQLLEM